ncbi:MAG: hypothetical protein ACOCVM_07710, partial [Desulfovibrionaceae bacterium]
MTPPTEKNPEVILQRRGSSRLGQFLLVFLPPALVLGLVAGLWAVSERRTLEREAAVEQHTLVGKQRDLLETRIGLALSDARFLAALASLELTRNARGEALEELGLLFRDFARGRAVYAQVRLLGPSGRELVRVDRREEGAAIVPPDQLQDKSGRPYFVRGMEADPAVYVSRFDLNVERGVLDRPFKPMLRLSCVAHAPSGEPLGLVVLNYQGRRLLDSVKRAGANMWLVNP